MISAVIAVNLTGPDILLGTSTMSGLKGTFEFET